jgi:hypothetical protein
MMPSPTGIGSKRPEQVFGESPRIAACMGKVDALSLEHEGARLFEANGGFARGSRRIHLPPGAGLRPPGPPRPLIAWSISVGSGVSMAIRQGALAELGGFDEALDMGAALPAAAIWTSSGDCWKQVTKSCTNRAWRRVMSTGAKGLRPRCKFSNTTAR